MDFAVPDDIVEFIEKLDDFIEREIKPMEQENDNIRFLDHRREDARTDWDRGGLPNKEWEDLMREARKKADAAGLYRYSYPKRLGGHGRHQPRDGRHPRAPGRRRASGCTATCRPSTPSSATSSA